MWLFAPKHLDLVVKSRLGTFTLTVSRSATGKDVFDRIVRSLGLREFWYFGLSCTDKVGEVIWIDLNKKVLDQNLRKQEPICLHLTLKFYPESVDKVILNLTKRLLYLHMRESIQCENLFCPPEMSLVLASYCAQEQYGDYDPSMHQPGLILSSNFLPPSLLQQFCCPALDLESIVFQLYARRAGTCREESIVSYLSICQDLDMYGLRHLPVTTPRGTPCLLTTDSLGLKFYSTCDILIPKTAFTLAELQGIQYIRNRVEFTVGMDSKQKFVVFTADTALAKRLMLCCLGYRDLYIRGLSDDPNLLGYVVEGAGKSIVNGLSMEPRLPDSIVMETRKTEAIVNDRLTKYDTERKAAIIKLVDVQRETSLLQHRVGGLEAVQHNTVQKQHMTIRTKSFYDFHTSMSAASIPALARDHRKMKQETHKLNVKVAQGGHMLEQHRQLLHQAQCAEGQLRRNVEVDFVTMDDLHVYNGGLPENDVCLSKDVELPSIAKEDLKQPCHGLFSFSKTNPKTSLEMMRISTQLEPFVIPAQQTVVDILHGRNAQLHVDKYTALTALLSQSVRDRVRVVDKM